MTIDKDIRDQAYHFFVIESEEHLQLIESELLTLRHDRSPAKVHSIMRAAHSIKGGSAAVGLPTIRTIAHHLEDFFKALHNEEIEIDDDLETLLLKAYDCLRIPLTEQINTGYFNEEEALANSEPIFAEINERLSSFAHQEDYLPSSAELGIDLTLSIFEVDVEQELSRLDDVVNNPEGKQVAGELRAVIEVFTGISELLSLPGLAEINQAVLDALNHHPEQVLTIAQLALTDYRQAQKDVMDGDRKKGGSPSATLLQLATENTSLTSSEDTNIYSLENASLDDVFGDGNFDINANNFQDTQQFNDNFQDNYNDLPSLDSVFTSDESSDNFTEIPSLDSVFTSEESQENLSEIPSLDNIFSAEESSDNFTEIPSLDSVFTSEEYRENLSEIPSLDSVFTSDESSEIPSLDSVFTSDESSEIPSLDSVFTSDESSDNFTEIPSLDSVFTSDESNEIPSLDSVFTSDESNEIPSLDSVFTSDESSDNFTEIPSLDSVFNSDESSEIPSLDSVFTSDESQENLTESPSLDSVFTSEESQENLSEIPSLDNVFTEDQNYIEVIEPTHSEIKQLESLFDHQIDNIPEEPINPIDLQPLPEIEISNLEPNIPDSIDVDIINLFETDLSTTEKIDPKKEIIGINVNSTTNIQLESPLAHLMDQIDTPINYLEETKLIPLEIEEKETNLVKIETLQIHTKPPVKTIATPPIKTTAIPPVKTIETPEKITATPPVKTTAIPPVKTIETPEKITEETSEPLTIIPTFIPSLEDVFGNFDITETQLTSATEKPSTEKPPTKKPTQLNNQTQPVREISPQNGKTLPIFTEQKPSDTQVEIKLQQAVKSIEKAFAKLPEIENINQQIPTPKVKTQNNIPIETTTHKPTETTNINPQLSVRVDLERLERMNNLVGELAISRNGLFLQNDQLQNAVKELIRKFNKFEEMAISMRILSDRMLVEGKQQTMDKKSPDTSKESSELSEINQEYHVINTSFDSLEMDSYGELNSLLQYSLEEVVQIEEIVGDIDLLVGQSSQAIESQRQKLNHLRDDLMWARMLPLGEVLSRFPRTLRDLSNSYKKPVDLKLSGTGVLVDKAALEKLYDPLLHLLRNAFDHGIETPEIRQKQGKSDRGKIEIRAYHQGSQTVVEIHDDGQGINLERVRKKAIDLKLMSLEQAASTNTAKLLDLLFEPGFSTANKVSELSGRGVGLDVVRSQLRSLKGTVSVSSTPGKGTTFTLRIPLTLTIAKLLVCLVGSSAFALPSDSIEEIIIPKVEQIRKSGIQRFLQWRKKIVPVYHLSQLINYAVPLPDSLPSQALVAFPTPENWQPPILLIRKDNRFFGLEIDRLVTEQELVIKPFGSSLTPPGYIYGCTILGDGTLVPVIDSISLINQTIGESQHQLSSTDSNNNILPIATHTDKSIEIEKSTEKKSVMSKKSPLILVVDDSITLRQTLALTLQKANYLVVQARDGREAINQLQQNPNIQLVISDVEMPNMNGFEFLNQRRQDPILSKVPVIMLTSRSSDKHRKIAMHLGASSYLTKPYIEQEFLNTIREILTKENQEKPQLVGAKNG
jgi:chemotaxis protein histidine kinase CheA/CheY-like chemotaxis protein